MFWNMLKIENFKIFRRSLLWVELALLAIVVLVAQSLLFVVSQNGPEMAIDGAREQLVQVVTWPGSLLNSLGFVGGNALGGLLVVILVGALITQEYTWRTLHLFLSRGIPRVTLLAAKFSALLVPLLLLVLTPLLVGGVLTAVFSLQLNGTLYLADLNLIELFLSVVRTAYTLLPYAGLAFLLAVATRSAIVAVGGGLAYSLLVETVILQILNLVGGAWSRIAVYTPAGLASGLLQLNQGAVSGHWQVNGQAVPTPDYLAPGLAALGIALWTLVFVGSALWIFRRQDLAE